MARPDDEVAADRPPAAAADRGPLHDVVVVSDLHLGRGKNPDSGRYFSLEAFFYDEDFRRFCRYLIADARVRAVPLRLVFNGDVFDLLRVEPLPAGPDASARERRYGPDGGETSAARMVAEILAGHPVFVDAVAELLASGVEVVFLPGNHDIELQLDDVQVELRRALLERVGDGAQGDAAEAVARADAGLRFAPWFHHEPGRLWIEHGCQYDAESAFRYPLRRSHPGADPAGAEAEAEADLPLGNFFQRYLYNSFGHITFIVPSTRANFRYLRWMIAHRPALVAKVLTSQLPFVFQLLRRLRSGLAPGRQALQATHEERLATLARESGLGERLLAIDALKGVRHDLVEALFALGYQLFKITSASLMGALCVLGLWFAGFQTINQLRFGTGLKAALFLMLNFLFISAAAAGAAYALLRGPPDTPPTPLFRAARFIAGLVDVPIVTFGHTHDEALWRIDRPSGAPAWYYNTGTWIAVFTHDDLMPREQVQFTYLRVRGLSAELLQWSPGRGEPLPVILLDEETRWGPVHPKGAPAP